MDSFHFMLIRMFHNLIWIVLFVLITEGIRWWLIAQGKRAISMISKCNSVNEANRIRNAAKAQRRWLRWSATLVLAAIFTFVVLIINDELFLSSFIILYIICIVFLAMIMQLFVKRLVSLDGNIEPIDLRTFDIHQLYSLWLRGFFTDEIQTSIENVRRSPKSVFTELTYIETIEARYKHKTYAVGNPKELDSPYGARRIYLNDSSWRDSVLLLMQNANDIHIRVCNTPSCQWELEQAASMLSKVTLIIDDIDAYNSLEDSIRRKLKLPELSSDIGWTFYALTFNHNGWIIQRLKREKNGYRATNSSSDKGAPYKEKRHIDEIVLPALLFIALLASAPDLASWGKGIHEVRTAFDRLNWEKNDWALWISHKLPIELDEDYSLTKCYSRDSSIVFEIDACSHNNGFTLSKTTCGSALELLFSGEKEKKNTFYEKVLADYRPLIFILSHDGVQYSTVFVSEEDLIDIGQLKRHIKGHRTREEELDNYYENVSLPMVY